MGISKKSKKAISKSAHFKKEQKGYFPKQVFDCRGSGGLKGE